MKPFLFKIILVLGLCHLFCLAGCKSITAVPDEKPITYNLIEVKGEIRENMVWTANNHYLLRGYVYVTNQAALTIEPGTVILGGNFQQDAYSHPDALIIEAGAKIFANGTEQKPIVFTSANVPGKRNSGDWGGIVLIGKAPHNRPGDFLFDADIRGSMNAFDQPADNSGSLQYVRIEYAGGSVCCSDLSGLRCYGVGSATTIDHVQVSHSAGDSFDWRGGTVNARHLISLSPFDDDFDLDWGYSGNVQFALSLRDPQIADASGSNCIESDNFNPGENADQSSLNPNKGMPLTKAILANVSSFAFAERPIATTLMGSGGYQSALHLRRNSAASVINSVFIGWPEGLRLDGTRSGTWKNVENGDLKLQGVTLANVGGALPLYGDVLTKDVRGAGDITDEQAISFFHTPAYRNVIIAGSELSSLLLDPSSFDLGAPKMLPQKNSSLLSSGVVSTKIANYFITPVSYRGAFATTDWTVGWVNWQPQDTDY
ncbi:cell shape-determining protein MreB [Dyadobacter sp. 3J3]|uniref:cell shape-determining protein MreB n=1 Tax=Dyadobacter sp. 3J3 TaxID=2606600 RepID=UPI001E3C81FE|nr:cell shape-determining protein MreB [Dyadobacter sp. 3J3]